MNNELRLMLDAYHQHFTTNTVILGPDLSWVTSQFDTDNCGACRAIESNILNALDSSWIDQGNDQDFGKDN